MIFLTVSRHFEERESSLSSKASRPFGYIRKVYLFLKGFVGLLGLVLVPGLEAVPGVYSNLPTWIERVS
jgi:hypothetical protein